jgi:putative ABC transport system permease protein
VDRPQQIVRLVQRYPKIGSRDSLPNAFYRTLRDRVTTLSSVFGEVEMDTVLTNPAPAEAIRVGFATPEYFEGLGVRPLYGRTFGDGDRDATGAVLSYGFWHRRFNGDVQALGRPMCGYPSPR